METHKTVFHIDEMKWFILILLLLLVFLLVGYNLVDDNTNKTTVPKTEMQRSTGNVPK